jgi:hypothetical protein
MAMKRRFAWAFTVLAVVLAVGAAAVYYWPEDSEDGSAPTVRRLSLMSAGGEAVTDANSEAKADAHVLPVAAKTAASGATRRDARPPLSLNPRLAVEAAQQSGSPQDALVAAQAIYRCRSLAGASQRALEKIHERGIRAAPKPMAGLVSPFEAAERMCQELDDSMKAQYEPMLRKAMGAGLRGAAASWLVTPEARAIKDAHGKKPALELLRRDATQCELRSLGTYKVAAYQYYEEFDANEVAAVYAASAQLYKDKKLNNNSVDKLMDTFMPWHALRIRIGVDEDVVKAMTAQILNSCA